MARALGAVTAAVLLVTAAQTVDVLDRALWPGLTNPAQGLKYVLLDADGAEIRTRRSIQGTRPLYRACNTLFTLRVDAGLGYERAWSNVRYRMVGDGYRIAERVCSWNDICMLRRVQLEEVAEMIARAAVQGSGESREISLWNLRMGELPFGSDFITGHMDRCSACVLNQTEDTAAADAQSVGVGVCALRPN